METSRPPIFSRISQVFSGSPTRTWLSTKSYGLFWHLRTSLIMAMHMCMCIDEQLESKQIPQQMHKLIEHTHTHKGSYKGLHNEVYRWAARQLERYMYIYTYVYTYVYIYMHITYPYQPTQEKQEKLLGHAVLCGFAVAMAAVEQPWSPRSEAPPTRVPQTCEPGS